jgi:ribonuclease VapC
VIVVDSSAFVAILAQEPEESRFARALGDAEARVMSAGNYVECAMVAEGRFRGRADLDDWLTYRRVDVRPVDLNLARMAADAFARFGKGRHPAGLNYGDCFAYALAKSLNAPLLYKGDDFSKTDIASALA